MRRGRSGFETSNVRRKPGQCRASQQSLPRYQAQATCCDDAACERCRENTPQQSVLGLAQHHVATHSGFDDVKIGKSENGLRWRATYVNSVLGSLSNIPFHLPSGPIRTATRSRAPHGNHRFDDFEEQARTILVASAIGISSLIAAVLKN